MQSTTEPIDPSPYPCGWLCVCASRTRDMFVTFVGGPHVYTFAAYILARASCVRMCVLGFVFAIVCACVCVCLEESVCL